MNKFNNFVRLLVRHLVGELHEAEVTDFHGHLRRCPACRRRHRQTRRTIKPKEEAPCPTCEGLLVPDEAEMGETAVLSGSELSSGVSAPA
jgi:anti-sigma factor RsiW